MWFLVTVAWRNLWRHRRRSLITAGAMSIGVGMCMASVAYSDGSFALMFDILVEQQLGHVQVHHPDYPGKRAMYDTLDGAAAMLAALDALPETAAASGRLYGYALVGGKERTEGAQLSGIDPVREVAVSGLDRNMTLGHMLGGAPQGEVVLGEDLARELAVGPGDQVVVVTQSADGSLGNALYTVVGTARTGNAMQDRSGAWVHLADLQALLVLPDQVHELTLLGRDADDLPGYAAAAREALGPGPLVQTWDEVSPQAAEMLALQDISVGLVLGLVFSVAAFGVLNTMLMSVFERTRELGVLKAIGLRPARMVWLIVVESVLLAALSAGMGLVVGGALDWYLVVYGLDFSGSIDSIEVMGMRIDPVLKGEVRPFGVIATLASVFVVAVLASLWPAIRAARLDPVTAIRSE